MEIKILIIMNIYEKLIFLKNILNVFSIIFNISFLIKHFYLKEFDPIQMFVGVGCFITAYSINKFIKLKF